MLKEKKSRVQTILTSSVLVQDCEYMQKYAHENTQRANRAARLQNSDWQIQMAHKYKYTIKNTNK